MASVSFTQREIDSNPVSGTELDRFLVQGDRTLFSPEEILKIDVNGEAANIPAGTVGQILKMIGGTPVFGNLAQSSNMAATGHFELNGLTINWNKVTALAALATSVQTFSKPFVTINLGSFVSVEDALLVPVQSISSTLLNTSIKNFDAVNVAAVVYVFSIGI